MSNVKDYRTQFTKVIKNISDDCSCLQVVTIHLVIFICFISLMIYHINLNIKDIYKQFSLSTIFSLMVVYLVTSAILYSTCLNKDLLDNATFVLVTQMCILSSLFLIWIIVRWNINPYYMVPTGYDYAKKIYRGGSNLAGTAVGGVLSIDNELKKI